MCSDFFDHQAAVIQNRGLRGIEIDRQILHDELFVRAKSFLIREHAAIAYQQIHETRSLGKKTAAIGAEYSVGDGPVAGESASVEKGCEVAAVVNVQVRQQDRVHAAQVQTQFA